jgi:hypothetical protein
MIRSERTGFFACRWHSEVDLRLLLWRDLLFIGTLVNLAAGFTSIVMLIQNFAPVLALAVHLAPVPYNIFLLLSVWRSKQSTQLTSTIAGIWFLLMLVV